MKKVILIFSTAFICKQVTSQLYIGVQGGGSLSGASIKAANIVSPSKMAKVLPGAGIVADIKAGKKFFIRSGINFHQNGVIIRTSRPGMPGEPSNMSDITNNATLRYLQVPLYAMVARPAGNIEFYGGAGPYYSFGIGGKVKTTINKNFDDGTKETVEYETRAFPADGGGASEFKRSDYGVCAIAGIRLHNGMFVSAGYQLGLKNIDRQSNTDTYKNRALQLSIGFYFKSKK